MHKLDVLNSGGFFHCISFGFSFSKRKWGNEDSKCVIPRKWKPHERQTNTWINLLMRNFHFRMYRRKEASLKRVDNKKKTQPRDIMCWKKDSKQEKLFKNNFGMKFFWLSHFMSMSDVDWTNKSGWNALEIFYLFSCLLSMKNSSIDVFPGMWRNWKTWAHLERRNTEMSVDNYSMQFFRGCKSLFKRNWLRSIVWQLKLPRACYLSSRVPELIAVSLKRPMWAKKSSAERGNIP